MNRPTKWSDITVNQYIKLMELYNSEIDEIDLTFKRLSIILNISEEEVYNIGLSEYNKIKEEIKFLETPPSNLKDVSVIKLDGVEYNLIELNKIKFGQLVDLEYYSKDLLNNIHHIISLLYNVDYKLVGEKMDIETALSVFFYIYALGMSFLPSDTKDYSMLDIAIQRMKVEKKKIKKELEKI